MAFQTKKLINNPNDVVTEFIEGLVETYPGLQYLNGFPEVKVVLRADVSGATYDKVAVISGGGSGHEPAHAGFVGEGMLTAAICGDVFASPSVNSILAGIRAVTGPMGCLLIVKNYTRDNLNFGLAAEEAKSEGYKVDMIIVGDDCALPPPRGIAGRRGLAGTIFVHKVAGAAAACGLSLSAVAAEAKHASEVIGTMGVALSICTLPSQVILDRFGIHREPSAAVADLQLSDVLKAILSIGTMGVDFSVCTLPGLRSDRLGTLPGLRSDRLGPGEMELGIGIHGEPGIAVVDLQPVDVVVSQVLNQILSPETNYVPITRGSRVVLMINGLGATPVMELMIAARKAVPSLQLEHGLVVDRVYTGSLMTSLDMAGFSISVMKVNEEILHRLDAPTKAPCWPVGADGNRPPVKIPVPLPLALSANSDETLTRPEQLNSLGYLLEAAIEAAVTALINLKDALNEWDRKVGDGDCGSTMFRGATAILEDMKYYPLNDPAETVNQIGSSIRRVMGGTRSGILYDIFFMAAYAQLRTTNKSDILPLHWAGALEAAIAAISRYGGASVGDRTMLDALVPASSVLEKRLVAWDGPVNAFVFSAEAAVAGAESTKHMQAQAVRSTYVSTDILTSIPDPGAMAAASWYSAAASAVLSKYQMSLRGDPFFASATFSWTEVRPDILLPPQDQQSTLLCSAFAATDAASSKHVLDGKSTVPILLSIQEFMDHIHARYRHDPKVFKDPKTGKMGSGLKPAFAMLKKYGVFEDKYYPFTGQQKEPPELPEAAHLAPRKFYCNHRFVKEEKIRDKAYMESLIRTQPLAAGLSIFSGFHSLDPKAIYEPEEHELYFCQLSLDKDDFADLWREIGLDPEPYGGMERHAVLIVGFGTENGIDYYIVKNTWGESWGHRGYAKVRRSMFDQFAIPENTRFR